jgi:hypothetical protein
LPLALAQAKRLLKKVRKIISRHPMRWASMSSRVWLLYFYFCALGEDEDFFSFSVSWRELLIPVLTLIVLLICSSGVGLSLVLQILKFLNSSFDYYSFQIQKLSGLNLKLSLILCTHQKLSKTRDWISMEFYNKL